jgi:hypothetical protein
MCTDMRSDFNLQAYKTGYYDQKAGLICLSGFGFIPASNNLLS